MSLCDYVRYIGSVWARRFVYFLAGYMRVNESSIKPEFAEWDKRFFFERVGS